MALLLTSTDEEWAVLPTFLLSCRPLIQLIRTVKQRQLRLRTMFQPWPGHTRGRGLVSGVVVPAVQVFIQSVLGHNIEVANYKIGTEITGNNRAPGAACRNGAGAGGVSARTGRHDPSYNH